MTARHLMALDYADYQANSILKKHAKNRPLGDIEHRHNYIPAQPVLSCRTVQIDLQGTRTYRPKSTVDILEEQQRLIRNLYSKQRVRTATSAPPRQRTDLGLKSAPDSFQRVNIEVKGRPLTSSSQSPYGNVVDQKFNVTQRRPKTTGHLKNVQPATDCFMVIKLDQDFFDSTRNKRRATKQIRNYWKTENHNLAVGKFVRGQKRPDDVPPTLDAWLTFGGAAGDENEGLIDAFASFKNSEEYYNIEGSVGSKVAKQMQKGDKIRIGINGVLQSRDLKVKKWSKENTDHKEDEAEKEGQCETIQDEGNQEENNEKYQLQTPRSPENKDDGEFAELFVENMADVLAEDVEEEEKDMSPEKAATPLNQPMKEVEDTPTQHIVPLSWDDQCSKPDVKVVTTCLNLGNEKRPVMSDTHPVIFEKLNSSMTRPKLALPRDDGFKVKQRLTTLKDKGNGKGVSSKVKIVYIDQLDKEQEEKINSLSIEEIITDKFGPKIQNNKANQKQRSLSNSSETMRMNEDFNSLPDGKKGQPSRPNQSRSRPSSNCSSVSEKNNGIPNPKFKTHPTNSSHHSVMAGDLSIMTPGVKFPSPISDLPKSGKSQGRVSPTKPILRPGIGSGSYVKAGPLQNETEYIKITSQLKIAPGGSALQASHHHYDYRPGSNTPQDGAHSPLNVDSELLATQVDNENNSNLNLSHDQDLSAFHDIIDDNNVNTNEDHNVSSLSESPAPTTVAISIPTADELSDKESLVNSPSRPVLDDDLTSFQRRERNMRNEQIDQLTDLLCNAVADS